MRSGASVAGKLARLRNGAGHVASQVAEQGSAELQNFFDDVQDLLAKVTDLDDHDVAALRSRVEDSLKAARESMQSGVRRVRDTAADWRDTAMEQAGSARRQVRKRPLTIGLAAAAIGLTLGALLARRRTK